MDKYCIPGEESPSVLYIQHNAHWKIKCNYISIKLDSKLLLIPPPYPEKIEVTVVSSPKRTNSSLALSK